MRSFVDRLVSWTGLIIAILLLLAGALLTWANQFIGDQVHDQLAMQDITMPQGDSLTSLPKADRSELEPYAGEKMTTGDQAKAFADHYILVHMNEASGGRTYEQVSGEFLALSDAQKAAPEGQQLGQLRQTLFMGNTLRGLLLNGYAFATIGKIAGYAAIGCFVGGLLLLVLAILGFLHARRAGERDVDGYDARGARAM